MIYHKASARNPKPKIFATQRKRVSRGYAGINRQEVDHGGTPAKEDIRLFQYFRDPYEIVAFVGEVLNGALI